MYGKLPDDLMSVVCLIYSSAKMEALQKCDQVLRGQIAKETFTEKKKERLWLLVKHDINM